MSTIVIMPGGFHPFHAGHMALYNSARKAFPDADLYVAATNSQEERPFPFAVKEKLAKVAGVESGHFIQVKSPFQAKEITQHYDPEQDVLIFVRSEKDRNESPKPGGTKKDGSPAYFQPWTGKDVQPFGKHAYFAYLPTVKFGPGITSATEIRKAWPTLDDRRKTAMVMSLYPAAQKNQKLAANIVAMLDQVMGGQLNEFAPGNGDDGLPHAEYVVYQCDPSDQFEFIGGPLYQTDSLGMAHKYAYEKYVKHRPLAFMIYQPHIESSRGNYGVKGISDGTEEVDEGAEEALQYATKAHAGQTRAGGDPYITHPMRVADHIKQYKKSHNLDALISAAYLHDTVEDTDTTHEALHDLFGGLVASLVKELTSDPEEIKKVGKAQYLAHKMAAMSSYALVIKLADRLDNVKDITTARTPEWRQKYKNETNHILNYIEKTRALSGTHQKLIGLIRDKLNELDKPEENTSVTETNVSESADYLEEK